MPSNNPETVEQKAVSYFERLGNINLWNGVRGMRASIASDKSHFRNREAEESHARKTAWGSDESKNNKSLYNESDMGDTILGNVTNQHPPAVVYPPQKSNASAIIAALSLAGLTAIGAAGATFVGMRLMNQNTKPDSSIVSPTFDDSTVSIGLGRIEDYEKQSK